MGWFSKKEEIPQIAAAPILPEFPKEDESGKKGLPELPTFPSTSKSENFNQAMVKSAVGDIPSSGENEVNVNFPEGSNVAGMPQEESLIPPKLPEAIPDAPKKTQVFPKAGEYKTVQDPLWYAEKHESIPEVPKKVPQEFPAKAIEPKVIPDHKQVVKKTEPIFVRIDKFQLAQKNLEQIKERVKEIESILGKIKDIKSREEAELNGWTEDVEKIKSQLSEIDSSVFDQL
ncbi:hypothetical protein KAI32_03940 [Candidatus Pacearchaeota archaeon]|nr:hypothetical protein [Candidatus Pacearchaeota archaeon]